MLERRKMDALPIVSGTRTAAASAAGADPDTFLAPIACADAPALSALVEKNRAWLARWMPWARDAPPANSEAFVIEALKAAREGTAFHFTIRHANEIVGSAGLHHVDRRTRSGNVGYWLSTSACGQGIATRAARALIGWALGELGLERVELHIHPDNERSRAVAQRLGCFHAGRASEARMPADLRDVDLFVATTQRWPAEPG